MTPREQAEAAWTPTSRYGHAGRAAVVAVAVGGGVRGPMGGVDAAAGDLVGEPGLVGGDEARGPGVGAVVLPVGGHHRSPAGVAGRRARRDPGAPGVAAASPHRGAKGGAELARRRDGRHGSGWSGRWVSENGYLFPSDLHPGPITPAHMGRIISACLPEGWTAHTLRHRFATAA